MHYKTKLGKTLATIAPLCTIFCSAFLLSLLAGSIFLTAKNGSAADEGSSTIDVTVQVASAIGLTTSADSSGSTVSIPITPSGTGGTLGTNDLVVNVQTNNATGYTLNMNSQTSDTSLAHTTTTASNIPSTTAPLATPAPLPTGHWGYWRWEDGRVTTPTTFSRIPGTTPDTLRTTTTPATVSNTTLTFAANIDRMQAQGHYQNTVVLTATANYSPPPSPPEPDPSNPTTYGAMQTMTDAECSTTRGTAYDARNGQTYYVQKIGNLCWMETNLRYAGDGDYDSSWGYADDRYATTASNTTATPNDDTRPLSTTASGYLGGSQATQYTTAGYFNPGGSTTLDTTTPGNNTTFYGYLYNWCAAMGGQANSCNDTTGAPQSNFDTTSICPAGWRLPTGSGGEYQAMVTAVNATNDTAGSTNLRNNFLAVYSGLYMSSALFQSSSGYYWSSSVLGTTQSYALTFTPSSVTPGNAQSKYYGSAVRCVKDVPPPPVMQTMTNAECSTTRGTAYDARDGQTYYVQKIGNLCWMESNLRYAGDGNYDSSWSYPDDRYATTTAGAANTANPNDNARPLTTVSGTQASAYEVAQLANPGGSTDYTNTTANGGFYGYLYNWCAAMGGQATACQGSAATQPDQNVSICPAGWRLPIGGNSGEYKSLNTAINSGSTTSDAGLRTNFLAVYSGGYDSGLVNQGRIGYVWSSTVYVATNAYNLYFYAANVDPGTVSFSKGIGFAVRCVI